MAAGPSRRRDHCRDRASAYTRAVKEAAPHALEITDRWHLLQNLGAAVEKTCHHSRTMTS
ncbi:transposase [Streptomyces flavidovirens]|uniref:transposase n=1 Tax=Streptomyces flavidovirens TaxID=67298 RepID=UPI0033BF43DA